MTTIPLPDHHPLPPGAEVALTFDQWGGDERVIRGRLRFVRSRDVAEVVTNALEGRDGSIREPYVAVFVDSNEELTSQEARELARLLVDAAAELDGWSS